MGRGMVPELGIVVRRERLRGQAHLRSRCLDLRWTVMCLRKRLAGGLVGGVALPARVLLPWLEDSPVAPDA